MYEKITIAVLFSAYIFTSTPILASTTGHFTSSPLLPSAGTVQPTPRMRPGESAVTLGPYLSAGPPAPRREQLEHVFSEPVIIVIILGVIAAVVGTILSFAFCIRLLMTKSTVDKKPPLEDTGEPLNSVEVVYTEASAEE